MKTIVKTIASICVCGPCAYGAQQPPEPKNVPQLMTASNGMKVGTVEQWEKVRAPELLNMFTKQEYVRRAVERPK